MATMFPSACQFRKSSAEVLLFAKLRTALGSDWVALHHVRWLQKEPGRNARDGEADFVLAHPEHGALVLEVKGGAVTFDAASGEWTSRSKKGSESSIKDPFDQAKDASYALMDHLRSLPGWPSRWGPIGYAVSFPDGRLGSAPLPHMAPVLIDVDDLEPPDRLEARLVEICGFWRRDTHTTEERGVARMVDSLAHDVRIEHPLRLDVEEAEREILRLSDQQFRILDMLDAERRVAVAGPAGAGKTLIAAEKARRLAAQGFDVLFTCFNRPLADHLRRALADQPGIRVSGFHQLCLDLAREAGVETWGKRDDPAFWDEKLPEYLGEAVDRLGPRFDALVVDEAQDFGESWWLALQMLLRQPDTGVIYVFFDDNQAIYRRPGGMPEGLVSARLAENWRNTSPIFDAVMGFYEGGKVTCAGPEGPPIEMLSVAKEDLRSELSKVLHRLIEEGDLAARDVAVLTPHSPAHSPVLGQVGAFKLTDDPVGKRDVRLSSIYRYKGLDAPAVVICDVDRFVEEEFTKLMYVACSRARAYLAVLLNEGTASS
jgi:hypothetical protein